MECLKRFIEQPATQLNDLNTIIPAIIDTKDVASAIKIVKALVKADLVKQEDFKYLISSEHLPTDQVLLFISQRVRVLLQSICSSTTAKTLEEVIDLITIVMEGQTLEILQKSCLVELVGACLQQAGSRLQVDFVERYASKFLDICIPTLKYITKQEFKTKNTFELLSAMPVFNDQNERLDTIFVKNTSDGEEDDMLSGFIKEAKQQYQVTWLSLLQKVAKQMRMKTSDEMLKAILIDIPVKVLQNFKDPLLLADFLIACLDENRNIEIQVYALKGLFLLLTNHGLDSPQYYKKLYALLQAQKEPKSSGYALRSVYQMDQDTKQRFFRLLDLSLRAPGLPSKLIASFMKRIARQIITGNIWVTNDILVCLSLISNLVKRHPRTYRLITRNKNSLSLGIHLDEDPYNSTELDPSATKALKSSLWEINIIMKQHQDTRVRDFCKLFKTDLLQRSNFVKMDQFMGDSLEFLVKDLESIDCVKEGLNLRKTLFKRHGLDLDQDQQDKPQTWMGQYEPVGKRVKLGERFENQDEFFVLNN